MANPNLQAELETLRGSYAQLVAEVAVLTACVAELTFRLNNDEDRHQREGHSNILLPPKRNTISTPMPQHQIPQTNLPTYYSGSTRANLSLSNASSSHQVASSSYPARSNTQATEPINQISTRDPPSKHSRQFTSFNIPRDVIFQKLVKEGILKPLQPTPQPAELPPTHRVNQYCEYHQGTGHTTRACFSLAHKIQDLIDNGTIPPPPKPNNVRNPMPQNSQVDPLSFTESHDPDPTSPFYQ